MAEQQVARGFHAPLHRTGRAFTAVEEQVVQVKVKEAVPEVGEQVAVVLESVPKVEVAGVEESVSEVD